MALWVDKHRPRQLKDLSFHADLTEQLTEAVSRDDFAHMLLYGPSGAGKHTRVRCILRELYGPGVERLKLDTRQFVTPSNKKLEIQTVSSNYHVELCPGDVGIYDRVVVQEIIKQMANTANIEVEKQKSFKVVVLTDVDRLTRDAQHALRRTMEKYASNCRIILVCESLTRVIEPLRSRCQAVRVAAPSDAEIKQGVAQVCSRERYALVPAVLDRVVELAAGNMRRALLMAEASRSGQIATAAKVPTPEWQQYIEDTARMIIKQQNAQVLLQVRERLYELLSRCVPANVIFVHLVKALIPHTPVSALDDVLTSAATAEHMLTRGSKQIFHLEAFVAAFMEVYHNAKAQ